MKTLMIAPFYEYRYGGAELIMRIQRRCLEERGVAIDVLCLEGGPEPQNGTLWRLPLPKPFKTHPLAIKRAIIFLNNPWFDRHFLGAIKRLPIPFETYDLIHCQTHYWVDMGHRLARQFGKPLALTFHDNLPREIPRELTHPALSLGLQWLEHLQGRYLRRVLRQCRWISGVSDHVDRKLARYLHPGGPPIYTIYNPHPPFDTSVNNLPAKKTGVPKALYIGRLSKEKGLDLLLEAMKGYREPIELTILGLEGPLQGLAQASADQDARIRLHPPVPHAQVQGFFQDHDIVCCPSVWNDPLPGTVIETRLYQKAILTTDRGGIPEILEGYRKAVIVETPGLNRAQLIEKLRAGLLRAVQLIPSPLDAQQEAGFLRRFSLESFAGHYYRLYMEGRLDRPVKV